MIKTIHPIQSLMQKLSSKLQTSMISNLIDNQLFYRAQVSGESLQLLRKIDLTWKYILIKQAETELLKRCNKNRFLNKLPEKDKSYAFRLLFSYRPISLP